MVTIDYLIKNREKPILLSKRWFVVWIKRMLTLPGLMRILWSTWYCRVRGGEVGCLSIIEGTRLRGKISNLVVGKHSFIAKTVNLALHNRITIGSSVVINDGVQLLTASHDLKNPLWQMYSKPIVVEDHAWIATNAIILPGVNIGKGAVVGAGSVVRSDVKEGAVVSGNPSCEVGYRCMSFEYSPVMLCAAYEAWVGKRQ